MSNKLATSDLYEAAYYILNGATLVKVERRMDLKKTKSAKDRPLLYWNLWLSGISDQALQAWKSHTAVANLRDFSYERKKLKKYLDSKTNKNAN